MVEVKVTGGQISEEEKNAYIERGIKKYGEANLEGIDIELDGDYVNLHYHITPVPFQRIRRITGYLVGTFITSYQWGVKMWHSNNDYGTSTTRHAKIYDPTTNRIETVTADYVKFLDLDNIIEQYKKDMIAKLN